MRDLTQGPVVRHIVAMAVPIALGMIFQTLYYLVDLYFVAHLGDAALAGVSAAGNVMFIVIGLTQVLGVGTIALISQAVGRKDQPEANLIFNQSLVLSAVLGGVTLLGGYATAHVYIESVAADAPTVAAGTQYLYWFLPGMALQFALVAMGSALRGTGIVKPTMVVQIVTVLFNVILAPILIAGWGTGRPLGVAGAGLASTLAIAAGVALLGVYFTRLEKYVSFHPDQWRPRLDAWKRMLAVGLPAGGEFLLLFLFIGVIYWCIREFGATAQAAFGIGSRVMQSIFLPAMAVAFATGPVVGQNFGARLHDRVRETFRKATLIGVAIMVSLTLMIHISPDLLVRGFTADPAVRAVAATYLAITSWNFAAQAIVLTCSSVFQGMGDTRPALLSSASRLLMFGVPAVWMSTQPWFQIEHLWYLSVVTMTLQALISWLLLRAQFRRRLPQLTAATVLG
ncbi:MAG TPA: MATE family efflux transporter [Povalibacter sp.]